MPPKKARFGNRGKGKGGKGKGKGGGRNDYRDYRDDDRGWGSRSNWGDDYGNDWGGYSSWDRGGRDDRWSSRDSWGPSAANPRDRDRFVTQMMEDDRYEWRKQNDPDFVSAATSGGSASNPHEAGKDDEGADDEIFDAALEKRRKHRREMKNNTHSKLDRLVDVAARLEFVEEELAKVADGKEPDDKLLTRAEWEVIKQRSAEKRQKAWEKAEREYAEHRATRPGGGSLKFIFWLLLELVSRNRNEGPWVWPDYRQDRCLFSTHIVAPCFLTFSHRVRSKTFEGGFDAPRFLSSEWFVGIRIDRVRSAPHPGAR